MELTTDQQIFEQIKKSQNILVVLPENLTADNLGSGLALRLFLQRLQKEVTLVSGGTLPDILSFLPTSDRLQANIAAGKSLVITVNTSQKKLDEVSYQTSDDKVQIYLKAKNEEFTPQDIVFSTDKFPLDLIIALDAKSPEDFGRFYEQHTDLFFETPKINIDNKSSNEYFGAINLVDITASSIAEILTDLLQKYELPLDQDIATCLLAGIIAKTHSFQHVLTTPKAFLKASELVALGARQQEIIKHIYKTKPLSLLKLWGRALARMKIHEQEKVIYSLLNFTDFEKAESSAEELLPTLKEFLDNLSGYKIITLLAQVSDNSVRLLAAVHEQVPQEKFTAALDGPVKILDFALGNYRVVEQNFSGLSLDALEKRFVEAIKAVAEPLPLV